MSAETAAKRFSLALVTPEKVAWEGEAEALVVPAHEGQLGILPGHAPLLAQLSPGVLQIRSGDDVNVVAVSGGFVEVFAGRVSVFAETAELAGEIDAERARQASERARASLKKAADGEPPDVDKALAAMKRAAVRLKAVQLARRSAPRGHPAS